MKKALILSSLTFIAIFLTGCSLGGFYGELDDDLSDPVITSSDDYVIFSNEKDISYFFEDEARFTPSNDEIRSILPILNDHLAQQSDLRELDEYKAQFFGVINKEGEKIIWANYFCSAEFNSDWKNNVVVVSDGGNCYFNVSINLETREVFDLFVNGEV